MTNPRIKALLLLLATVVAGTAPCQNPGDLIVTPTRILLDDKGRSGDITLVNRGLQPIRYRLSLVDMAMDEQGALRRVPSTPNSAASALRLSPREILLQPGAAQRIKILVTFPRDMAEGELRSHLAFEPIATPRAPHPSISDASGIRLSFEVRSVVTIPVIAQHGSLTATAALDQVELHHQPGEPAISFRLARNGNRTIRGDLTVTFKPDGKGAPVVLARVTGLPVYFPNSRRTMRVRLERSHRGLGKGRVEVVFAEPSRVKGAAIARAAVDVSG